MSKAYDKWLNRVNDYKTPWTEQEIIYFRKAIGLAGIKDSNLRADLYHSFVDQAGIYNITQEQSEKGRQYLLDKSLKRNGQMRKGSKLTERELAVLRDPTMIHYFVGLWGIGGHYLPIYRAQTESEAAFEYTGTTYDRMMVFG